MSNVLLMHNNYVRSDFLTGQTKSSELAAAPATNIYDKVRRSKVYRTNGYWEITAANKVIIFRETDGGSDLTATVAEDEYTSDALFFAAIKTAMEAAGDSTYTVSRDTTTLKIKITAVLAGGATVFQLRTADAAFTMAATLGYATGGHLSGALVYTADTLKIHTSEWVRWDCGTAVNPKAFAIMGSLENGLGVSSAATVTLEGNETDVWTGPSYTQTLTYNENCMALFDTEGLHTGGLRYWRMKIVDTGNTAGYVEIAKVYLGEVYETAQGAVQFPLDDQFVDLSDTQRSEFGTAFSNRRIITEEFGFSWNYLTKVDKEAFEAFIRIYGTSYPFWIALDPNEVISTDSQNWVRFCRFMAPPKITLDRPNVWASPWVLREEA